MPNDQKPLLRRLARLFNVQTAHYDGLGRRVEPPPEAVLSVLRVLGASAESLADLPGAFRERRQALWRMVIDPVVVAWEDTAPRVKLRLPTALADVAVDYEIALEGGATLTGRCLDDAQAPERAGKIAARLIEGINYVSRLAIIPLKPPTGYHRLHLTIGDFTAESYLFVAPAVAYGQLSRSTKSWGLFCPVYALFSETSWGIGDIADLERFADFAAACGARVVSTVPLLSAFLDEPFNPSPYAPVSRIFWNELFLDVIRIPELSACPAARRLLDSPAFKTELHELRDARYIDYRRVTSLKRSMLQTLMQQLLNRPSERRTDLERFIATHPMAQDYAAFRAKAERERLPWDRWPENNRDGALTAGDYDDSARQYHLYVQWLAHEQVRALGAKSKAGGAALYLDFPLGVNRDGYDVWRHRDVFALTASGGAPPDGFFTKGQDWGFPPFHPEGLRRQGYRYYIHCMRHHLQYADMLRIDHVMGLHRAYWVPQGFSPTEGVYVRYPAEEFHAVVNLESHRHQAEIVGENLGTVPSYVNSAMARHGLRGMHVSQFGVRTDPREALDTPRRGTVASLNTHDTPTFAGFWSGADIDDRADLGLLTDAERISEHSNRSAQRDALVSYLRTSNWLDGGEATAAKVLVAWLSALAESDADFLLVNLEDLWLEPLPQNVPGTWEERPNWRRRARFSLDSIERMPELINLLKRIDGIRKTAR